jgi:CRISPR-associated protein Cmr6
MRPLYLEAKTITDKPDQCNSGLWYDKFCDTWVNDRGEFGDNGKKKWIDKMTISSVGNRLLLRESYLRRQRLVKAVSGCFISLTANTVFVSGLGRSHPVENGFAWHQTLGTPYLPGSSVKGVVRAWADWVMSELDDKQNIERIFGPKCDNDNTCKHVGSVIFLDALPTTPVTLKAEILTPHYDPWYKNSTQPPADWYNPIPITFLAVEAGHTFSFGIMPTNPTDTQDKADCITACEWLKNALEMSGAGAKTAIGFGRFDPPKESSLAENEEVWPNAMLSWDKGRSSLTATFGTCKATKKLQEDRSAIPSELHNQLFIKNRLTTAKVTVSRQGNMIQIVRIEVT